VLCVALALVVSAVLAGASAAAQPGPNAFTFVALGDMPYRDADIEKVDRLIAAINRLKPAFSIMSATSNPGAPCSDPDLERALDQMSSASCPDRG
jgi:hypothetical protein